MDAAVKDGVLLPRTDYSGLPAVNPNILKLENKQMTLKDTKPVLGHEFGAGAPCLKCKDKCPGLDLHFWRKMCKECKCLKEDHDVQMEGEEDPGKIRIGRLFDTPPHKQTNSSVPKGMVKTREETQTEEQRAKEDNDRDRLGDTFAWVPPDTNAQLVHKYMEALPEAERPLVGTEGAVKRRQQLAWQLPLHDSDPQSCHSQDEKDQSHMQKYVEMIKSEVVGIGKVAEVSKLKHEEGEAMNLPVTHCHACEESFADGDIGVYTQHTANSAWHPNCFRCSTCKNLLVDMLYFCKDGQYYCGRHFGDTLYPRCGGCDELIFAKEYTHAEGRDWHLNHFCCFLCDMKLGGHKYMQRENNNLYCITCYMSLFARTCRNCGEKIGPDVQRVTRKEMHWHATNECFHCCQCRHSLLGAKFVIKEDNVFCPGDCKRKFYGQI